VRYRDRQRDGATEEIYDTPIRVAEISTSENLDGERKSITALFADIKGSMDLMEDIDPEEARDNR
jgi:class 3 adenylate cyclase